MLHSPYIVRCPRYAIQYPPSLHAVCPPPGPKNAGRNEILGANYLAGRKNVLSLHPLSRNNVQSHAEIAQLVEHNLAKVGVAISSLVFRSQIFPGEVAELVGALL